MRWSSLMSSSRGEEVYGRAAESAGSLEPLIVEMAGKCIQGMNWVMRMKESKTEAR